MATDNEAAPRQRPAKVTGPEKSNDPRAVYRELSTGVLAQLESPMFRALQVEQRLQYDVAHFPFRELVQDALGVADLDKLHEGMGSFSRSTSSKHQKKRVLAPVLATLENRGGLNALMDRFMCEYIAPHMDAIMPGESTFFYGKFCLRAQPPAERNIGYAHCDAQYSHQPGQINFWIPLTKVGAMNSLYVESAPGRRDFHPFEGGPGDVFRFYGNQCVHHTVANEGDVTRVSIDFRVVPGSCFERDPVVSRQRNGYQKFQVGVNDEGYYSRCYRVGADAAGERSAVFATDNTYTEQQDAGADGDTTCAAPEGGGQIELD